MPRYYKQLSTCTVCKQRFEVIKEKGMYRSSSYCPKCSEKYYPKKEIKPEEE